MRKKLPLLFFCILIFSIFSLSSQEVQRHSPHSTLSKRKINKILRNLYTTDYLKLKSKITKKYEKSKSGEFGEFIHGVFEGFETNEKQIALTFDACVGHENDYNFELVNYLRKEKIPATLFVSGLWIDANIDTLKNLSANPLFEIENHGLLHRLCSINGESVYRIKPTENVGDVVDEMELNARKIAQITGKRPKFFRSATAYTDETCTKIAKELGMKVISFDILSGDAVPFAPAELIKDNIIKNAHSGAIVIMHFNHPKWFEKQALEIAIPLLKAQGYKFVKLEDVKLKEESIKKAVN